MVQPSFPGGERTTPSGLILPTTAEGVPDIFGGGEPLEYTWQPVSGFSVQALEQFTANALIVDAGANYLYFPDEAKGVDPWTRGKVIHLPMGRRAIAVTVTPLPPSTVPNLGDPNLQLASIQAVQDQFPPSPGVNTGAQQVTVIGTMQIPSGGYQIVTGLARGLLVAVWTPAVFPAGVADVTVEGLNEVGDANPFLYSAPAASAIQGSSLAMFFAFGPGTSMFSGVGDFAGADGSGDTVVPVPINVTWHLAPIIQFSVNTPLPAPWGLIGGAHAAANTGGSPAVITVDDSAVPAGSLVLVGTMQRTNVGNTPPFDSRGNTYTRVTSQVHPGGATNGMDLWYSVLTTALQIGDTITFDVNAAAIDATALAIWQPWNSAAPLDVSHAASGTGTGPSSGFTGNTTNANEVAVGLIGSFAPAEDTLTPAGSFATVASFSWEDSANSIWVNLFFMSENLTAITNVIASGTLASGADGWGAFAATFDVTYPTFYLSGRLFL